MRSDVVGCMDESNMMVVIHPDSRCALTTPSMTVMPSLIETLLVNFSSSSNCTFPPICKTQENIALIKCQPTQFGVVLATGPVLDPAGFIGLRGNGLTPSKIDDFLCEPSL
jgi:hypothetical protein